MKRAVILVVLYLCWTTFQNFSKLSSGKEDTELDNMITLVAGVEKYLSPDSHIAFKTNTPSDRRGVLYFKSALALAPAVLRLESEADTVFLLEELALPSVPKDQYSIISHSANQQMSYTLMRLKK